LVINSTDQLWLAITSTEEKKETKP
jgi:hypothetical protein